MPEPIAPAAPAAPTPPPAAPAAPAAPGGGDEPPSASDAFDKQFELDTPGTPPPAPAKPVAPAAPAPAKPAAAPAKPAAPAAAAPAQEFEEVEGIKVPKFKSDKDFRGWGLGGYKKAKQLETELESLRSKHTELEQVVPRTQAEKTQLATKLAELEKKHNEVLSELNFANYERSPEYKDKYEKPFQDAYNRALRDVAELTVTEEDRSQPADENGKYPTKDRPAKPEDFDQIYQLQLGAATKLAAKKFGAEAASIVIGHRNTIRQAAEAAVNALKEWKANAAKRQQEMEVQSTQTRERMNSLWTQVNADIREKSKDLFQERPDDKEWNEALAKGTAMADAYFGDRSAQPMEQKVVFDAHVRNRVAAFPALVSRMRKLEAENAQLAKDLAELRGSGPGKPGIESPTPPVAESEGALAEFDKRL